MIFESRSPASFSGKRAFACGSPACALQCSHLASASGSKCEEETRTEIITGPAVIIGVGRRSVNATRPLPWWEPPHLCGGRSASALRENSLASIMRFSAGAATCIRARLQSAAGKRRNHLQTGAVSRPGKTHTNEGTASAVPKSSNLGSAPEVRSSCKSAIDESYSGPEGHKVRFVAAQLKPCPSSVRLCAAWKAAEETTLAVSRIYSAAS